METLVENRTSYTLQNAELHLFETHTKAEQIHLKFDQPLLASMLTGKKIMHLNGSDAFDFLPGETLLLPPEEVMYIDFPEARMDNPTKCLALAISQDTIEDTILWLNEHKPREDGEWTFADYNLRFTNDIAIQQIIQRLIFVFAENHRSKDIFADFMLRELIIRILQSESKRIYSGNHIDHNKSRLAHIITYIQQNLHLELSVKELSNKAYMSESNFHRVFKNEFNLSPIEFINEERIKLAARLLRNPRMKIKDIYMSCGFKSLSYFSRMFKRKTNQSPKQYQKQQESKL